MHLLRASLTNLDALAIDLGELLKGATHLEATSGLHNLQNALHNHVQHSAENAQAGASNVRSSANRL